ncbi:hypothetical protein vBBaMIFTN4_41 [Bordetella phage vB_BaM-IFTN4]|nr:hypothetical protein vBBaMIFTN4_41 [Bordetella phage vB_BaM-IFTN4]
MRIVRLQCSLRTFHLRRDYLAHITETSVIRDCSPGAKADEPPQKSCGYFFVRSMAPPMGGPCGRGAIPCRFLSPVLQPTRSPPTPIAVGKRIRNRLLRNQP